MKVLYGQWVISLELIPNVDIEILSVNELIEAMLKSRLAADNIYCEDVLLQVVEKPFAYGKIIGSKALLATSPITHETWYFRSYSSFNDFVEEAFGFKLSFTILYNIFDKTDSNGLFLGLHIEDPITLDKAKKFYPNLYTYHDTPFNNSKLFTVMKSEDKAISYRDWAKKHRSKLRLKNLPRGISLYRIQPV